jgi:hypothetical protein
MRNDEGGKMEKNLIIAICLFFMAGCSHPLTIKNLPETSNFDGLTEPVDLGFLPVKGEMLDAVIQEIGYCRGVKKVTKSCKFDQYTEFDHLMDLSNSMTFKASGQNFFITFPGFLIFAHAGIGYKYTVNVETKSKMFNDDGTTADEITILTPYEIRYTSFARGAASSSGWYLPGFGLTNIIPGLIFSSNYDERANQDFLKAAEPSYKKIITAKVITQVENNHYASISKSPQKFVTPNIYLENENDKHLELLDNPELISFYLYKIENNELISLNRSVVKVNEAEKELISSITEKEKISNENQLKTLWAIIESSNFLSNKDFQSAKLFIQKDGRNIVVHDGEISNIKIAQY